MNISDLWFTYRYRMAAGIVMTCAGLAIGQLADRWTPFVPVMPVQAIVRPAGAARIFVLPATPATAVTALEAEHVPEFRPDLLSLASAYGDGDSGPGAMSLAEQLLAELSSREAQWNSEIYGLYNQTPATLAGRLSLPVQQLIGRYNPVDEKQDPANPDTWIVPGFKGIQVTFLDGAGNSSEWRSNLKEIVAMVNVYRAYEPETGAEALSAYAMNLWEASHRYSFQISPVYYCEGCMAEAQSAAPEATEAGTEAVYIPVEGVNGGPGVTAMAVAQENAGADGQEDEASAGSADGQQIEASAGNTDGQQMETSAGNTDGQQAEAPARSADGQQAKGSAVSADGQQPETSPGSADGQSPGVPDGQQTYTCPGHVDLQIQLQVAGLEDAGLFERDSLGNDPAGIRESGWPGWNEETKGYVRALTEQDWYTDYGLTVETAVVRNPLTALDVDLYMQLLPEDTTALRRDLVRFALTSVGRVPYYWGGKPGAPGYEANRFGVLTAADEDGRFLKGLDCSGWINWVYWSVTGQRLAGESTSTLSSCGRAITRDELLPGDICIRPGENAHVVMFLGWTADGQMLCIQETSGNINNVEVGIVKPEWPCYRRLLD